jgi:hypothetical protein
MAVFQPPRVKYVIEVETDHIHLSRYNPNTVDDFQISSMSDITIVFDRPVISPIELNYHSDAGFTIADIITLIVNEFREIYLNLDQYEIAEQCFEDYYLDKLLFDGEKYHFKMSVLA